MLFELRITLSGLPPELIQLIAEHLFTISPADLAAFIRCSQGICNLAQPVLYRILTTDEMTHVFNWACRRNCVPAIQRIMSRYLPLCKANPKLGLNALVAACATGCFSVVSYLIATGISPNHPDGAFTKETTPLTQAVESDRPDIVNFLIARDADLKLPPYRSSWPRPDAGAANILHYAAMKGSWRVCESLLYSGGLIDVDKPDQYGCTALSKAAMAGSVETVRVLVAARADVNEVDYHHGTPLFYAVRSGNLAVVKVLVEAGADLEMQCFSGLSLLYHANKKGHVGVARFLLEKPVEQGWDNRSQGLEQPVGVSVC
ncbi:ankyrin repeat-containing domain protein [Aspergillus aurantiobrunneus]